MRGLLPANIQHLYSAALLTAVGVLLLSRFSTHYSALAWLPFCTSTEYKFCGVNFLYDRRMKDSLGDYLGWEHTNVEKYLQDVIDAVNKIFYAEYLGGCTVLQFRILAMTDVSPPPSLFEITQGFCARNYVLCTDADSPTTRAMRNALIPYYRKDACINAFITDTHYRDEFGTITYGDAYTNNKGTSGLCNNDVRTGIDREQTISNVALLSTRYRDVSRSIDDHSVEYAHYFARLTGALPDYLGNCASGKLMDSEVSRATGEISSCAKKHMARFLERLAKSEKNCLMSQ